MHLTWKHGLVALGALGLLVAATSDANAAPTPDPVPPPDPNPPPGPRPGPHPPPWPGMPTATVRVTGFGGMRVRTGPGTNFPVIAGQGEILNGQRVAVLEESVDEATGRFWMRIYTPLGYEGWSSSVDPQGNRNIFYDGVPDVGQTNPNPRPRVADTEALPAQMAGSGHGWYPYARPARAVPVRQAGNVAFRPRG